MGSKAGKACAEAELEGGVARFPAAEVEGPEEKLGMGRCSTSSSSNPQS